MWRAESIKDRASSKTLPLCTLSPCTQNLGRGQDLTCDKACHLETGQEAILSSQPHDEEFLQAEWPPGTALLKADSVAAVSTPSSLPQGHNGTMMAILL
jgi:hypothetical protein